jgi:hypothetical protein
VNKLGDSQRECDKVKRVQVVRCATLGSSFLINKNQYNTDYHYCSYVIPPCDTNTFDQISLSLRSVPRLTSKDRYKDYNPQDLHDPGEGALAWWGQTLKGSAGLGLHL